MLEILQGNLKKLFNTSGGDYKEMNLKEEVLQRGPRSRLWKPFPATAIWSNDLSPCTAKMASLVSRSQNGLPFSIKCDKLIIVHLSIIMSTHKTLFLLCALGGRDTLFSA